MLSSCRECLLTESVGGAESGSHWDRKFWTLLLLTDTPLLCWAPRRTVRLPTSSISVWVSAVLGSLMGMSHLVQDGPYWREFSTESAITTTAWMCNTTRSPQMDNNDLSDNRILRISRETIELVVYSKKFGQCLRFSEGPPFVTM